MKKPCLGSILVGLIPFIAICFAVPLWDRIDPVILGLPFNMFWLALWIIITPPIMWFGAYRQEVRSEAASEKKQGGTR